MDPSCKDSEVDTKRLLFVVSDIFILFVDGDDLSPYVPLRDPENDSLEAFAVFGQYHARIVIQFVFHRLQVRALYVLLEYLGVC